jgi:hypothetical protein
MFNIISRNGHLNVDRMSLEYDPNENEPLLNNGENQNQASDCVTVFSKK